MTFKSRCSIAASTACRTSTGFSCCRLPGRPPDIARRVPSVSAGSAEGWLVFGRRTRDTLRAPAVWSATACVGGVGVNAERVPDPLAVWAPLLPDEAAIWSDTRKSTIIAASRQTFLVCLTVDIEGTDLTTHARLASATADSTVLNGVYPAVLAHTQGWSAVQRTRFHPGGSAGWSGPVVERVAAHHLRATERRRGGNCLPGPPTCPGELT